MDHVCSCVHFTTFFCRLLQAWRQPMAMLLQIWGWYPGVLKGAWATVERRVSECSSGRMGVCRSSWEAARSWTLHFVVNWTSRAPSWSTTHRTRPKTNSRSSSSSRTRQRARPSTQVELTLCLLVTFSCSHWITPPQMINNICTKFHIFTPFEPLNKFEVFLSHMWAPWSFLSYYMSHKSVMFQIWYKKREILLTLINMESFYIIIHKWMQNWPLLQCFLSLSYRSISRTPAGDPSFTSTSWRDDQNQWETPRTVRKKVTGSWERLRWTHTNSHKLISCLKLLTMLLMSSNHLICVCVWSAATNIFIAGSEDHQSHISSELHFLLTQNHTLKEQLNQGARGNKL